MAAPDLPTSVRNPPDLPVVTEETGNQPLSRSPHPYHRRGINCSSSSTENGDTDHPTPTWTMTPKPSSDSGTEADDEGSGLLKGLPAPHFPTHRRRDRDGETQVVRRRSGANTSRKDSGEGTGTDNTDGRGGISVRKKKRLEVLRRILETAMVLSVGATVLSQKDARAAASSWDKGTSRSRLGFRSMLTIFDT